MQPAPRIELKKCCRLHKKAHDDLINQIKVHLYLFGGNPCYIPSLYNQWAKRMSASEISIILNKDCPCKRIERGEVLNVEHVWKEQAK